MSTSPVERCLDIIELLASEPDGLAVSEIGDRLALPISGAHRLLNMLIARAYVVQDTTRHYRLTMRLARLGFGFLAETGIAEICQPVLEDLAGKVGEFVRMTVVDGDGLVWIGDAQGARSSIVVDATMTDTIPLHAAANAKVWLGSLPEEKAVELVMRQGFGAPEDYGPNAIRTVQALLEELAKTRASGYGLNMEESESGAVVVAVAIRRQDKNDGTVLGTLSVAAPAFRTTRKRLVGFVPEMTKAADELAALWPVLQHGLQNEETPRHRGKAAIG